MLRSCVMGDPKCVYLKFQPRSLVCVLMRNCRLLCWEMGLLKLILSMQASNQQGGKLYH